MEYISGETIEEYITRTGEPIPCQQAGQDTSVRCEDNRGSAQTGSFASWNWAGFDMDPAGRHGQNA